MKSRSNWRCAPALLVSLICRFLVARWEPPALPQGPVGDLPILGMHDVHQLLAQQLLLRVAQERFHRVVDEDRATGRIQHINDGRGVFDEAAVQHVHAVELLLKLDFDGGVAEDEEPSRELPRVIPGHGDELCRYLHAEVGLQPYGEPWQNGA